MKQATIHKRDALYSKPELKARGWTGGLIAKFLPIADDLRDNPYSKQSPPMSLYLRTRVEQIESSDDFKVAVEHAEARKAGHARRLRPRPPPSKGAANRRRSR